LIKSKIIWTTLFVLLWCCLPAIAIALAAEIISGRPALQAAFWIKDTPVPFLVSLLFSGALLLGFIGLTARPVLSMILAGGPLLVLAAINGEKFRYLSEHLYPWDLMSARQIVDLLPALIKDASIKRALLVLLIICAVSAVLFVARRLIVFRLPIAWPLRIIAVLCAAFPLSVPAYNLMDERNTNILSEFGIVNYNWNQRLNHNRNGFLVSFIANTQGAIIRAPDEYAASDLTSVLNYVLEPQIDTSQSSGKENVATPNVIVLMSEAFWDPTLLPSVTYSEDPLRFFHSLHAQQSQNYQISPAFAGATANVEFEALTGFSNAFLPYGSIPYQQYINRPVPSLASLFSSMGYETTAIHTYHGWFWRRNRVYEHFGFDKFLDIKEFSKDQTKGMYISDDALTERIVTELAEAKKPKFIFAVSMQNHSPYAAGRYADNTIKVSGPQLGPAQRDTLETYAQGIRDADRAFETLVNAVEASGKPTLILFFGDHLPFLGADLDVYRRTGFLSEPGATGQESAIRLKRNPFVLWSNFGAPTQAGTISPAFFPTFITRALGVKHPFYSDVLGSVMADWPVVELALSHDRSGSVKSITEAKKHPKLKAYQWIQHDIMFGDQYSHPTLFDRAREIKAARTSTP
jgi:phosphoglycerol transferase MdoB-like AlkP superfamily enzyme